MDFCLFGPIGRLPRTSLARRLLCELLRRTWGISLSIGVPGGDVDRLSAIVAKVADARSMKVAF